MNAHVQSAQADFVWSEPRFQPPRRGSRPIWMIDYARHQIGRAWMARLAADLDAWIPRDNGLGRWMTPGAGARYRMMDSALGWIGRMWMTLGRRMESDDGFGAALTRSDVDDAAGPAHGIG